jgi:hypothetical protein
MFFGAHDQLYPKFISHRRFDIADDTALIDESLIDAERIFHIVESTTNLLVCFEYHQNKVHLV